MGNTEGNPLNNPGLYSNAKRRVDRREADDRRGHHLNLVSPDEEFYNDVVAWLMENGDEKWTIGSNENEPGNSEITCRVRFETGELLSEFVTWLDAKVNQSQSI